MRITNTAVAAFAVGFATGAVATGLGVAAVMSTPGTLPLTFDLPTQTISSVMPAEDDPDWDCRLHGDQVCGPAGDNFGHAPGDYRSTRPVVSARIDCTETVVLIGCDR